ncbi:MAG: TIGR03643 family protein [Rickettsiales bacterium]|nr:TIGR03643 family protein [Rickettsiales bacterium]|tara:strand:+ start:431 stop:691 length:261 start_codon:yes stop_codon:yes gene_type:complete
MKDYEVSHIIELAWADDVSFNLIEKETGLAEEDVIEIMRSNLKRRSFEHWRKRVTGRKTKHTKLLSKDEDVLDTKQNVAQDYTVYS